IGVRRVEQLFGLLGRELGGARLLPRLVTLLGAGRDDDGERQYADREHRERDEQLDQREAGAGRGLAAPRRVRARGHCLYTNPAIDTASVSVFVPVLIEIVPPVDGILSVPLTSKISVSVGVSETFRNLLSSGSVLVVTSSPLVTT